MSTRSQYFGSVGASFKLNSYPFHQRREHQRPMMLRRCPMKYAPHDTRNMLGSPSFLGRHAHFNPRLKKCIECREDQYPTVFGYKHLELSLQNDSNAPLAQSFCGFRFRAWFAYRSKQIALLQCGSRAPKQTIASENDSPHGKGFLGELCGSGTQLTLTHFLELVKRMAWGPHEGASGKAFGSHQAKPQS